MSDAAAATTPAPAKKATKVKKASKPKVPAAHPSFQDMITKAIAALKERTGSSKQAIVKYIIANFKVGTDATKVNSRVKFGLKALVAKGTLNQVKGTGASGSFKLDKTKTEKAKKPAVKKAAKAKKPAAAKAKKPAAKKAKKPAAKKPAAKKAAKPAAKKTKSPKKPKATKPKAKKPAAKKTAAKKAAKK